MKSLITLIVTFRVVEATAATCGSSSTAVLLRPLQSLLLSSVSGLSQILASLDLLSFTTTGCFAWHEQPAATAAIAAAAAAALVEPVVVAVSSSAVFTEITEFLHATTATLNVLLLFLREN